MEPNEQSFKEKLEASHQFPGSYTFKFIVKKELQDRVEQLVPDANIRFKPSSGDKYVSVTIEANMSSADEVIRIYVEAKKIDGIISL